jgi:RNA polymerase sigma factor (sigma-70 family)
MRSSNGRRLRSSHQASRNGCSAAMARQRSSHGRSRGLREVSIDDLGRKEKITRGPEMHDSRPSPEGVFLKNEQNRILSAAMNRLTPKIRKAIEPRELGELSMEEAARVMGLSVGAVKARVFHGRRKSHQALKREFGWMCRKPILRTNRKPNGLSRHQLVCDSCD